MANTTDIYKSALDTINKEINKQRKIQDSTEFHQEVHRKALANEIIWQREKVKILERLTRDLEGTIGENNGNSK